MENKCPCNSFQLWKGTWELKHYYKNHMYDYLYLVCSICNKSDEFLQDNYIACIQCRNKYCSQCKNNSLVDFKCCDCSDELTKMQCSLCEFWYCNQCGVNECPNCTLHFK